MAEHVVPVKVVQDIAGQIAVIAATALIQSAGDAANAIARLESMRGKIAVHANAVGWSWDVVEAAQQAINQAAEINEADE